MSKNLEEQFKGKREISLGDAKMLVNEEIGSFLDFGGTENYIFYLNGSTYVLRNGSFGKKDLFYEILRGKD